MSFSFAQPEFDLSVVQWRRRILLACIILVIGFLLPFVCAVWLHTNPLLYAQIEHAGIFLIFVAMPGERGARCILEDIRRLFSSRLDPIR